MYVYSFQRVYIHGGTPPEKIERKKKEGNNHEHVQNIQTQPGSAPYPLPDPLLLLKRLRRQFFFLRRRRGES